MPKFLYSSHCCSFSYQLVSLQQRKENSVESKSILFLFLIQGSLQETFKVGGSLMKGTKQSQNCLKSSEILKTVLLFQDFHSRAQVFCMLWHQNLQTIHLHTSPQASWNAYPWNLAEGLAFSMRAVEFAQPTVVSEAQHCAVSQRNLHSTQVTIP